MGENGESYKSGLSFRHGDCMRLPRYTIVIPTYQRDDDLADCLDSISRNSRLPHSVLVLSPSRNQVLVDLCLKYGATLQDDGSRIDGKRVRSLWGILNYGIEQATADWVVWLNDDCLVNPGWDEQAFMEENDKVALMVLTAKGILNSSAYRVLRDPGGVPCANYAALRKSTGFRFDESFSWFYGDADIAMQVAASKWELVVVDFPGVIHHHRQDSNRTANESDPRADQDRRKMDRKWRYWKTQGGRASRMDLPEALWKFARVWSTALRDAIRPREPSL